MHDIPMGFSSIHGRFPTFTIREWPDKALIQDIGMEENQLVRMKSSEELLGLWENR